MESKTKLLDQMRLVLRLKHMSIRIEDTYVHWVRRFILFYNKRHPQEMGAPEIRAFLAHLALHNQVASSTQNVALNALERVMYSGVSTDSARSSSGHSRARGNPGGHPDLDPGVRRDDVSSLHPYTWQSVQCA